MSANDEQFFESQFPRRRRSTSFDSKAIKKCREIWYNKIPEKQMKKFASSSSLFNPDSSDSGRSCGSPKMKTKIIANCNYYNLLVNWYKDFKTVKPLLLTMYDANIFKTEFPRHDLNLKECPSPIIFIVCSNLKIDNDYEVYLLRDYNTRLKELLEWSEHENKDLFQEYSCGLELIDKQVAGCDQVSTNDDSEKLSNQKSNYRRHSETMALIIQNKNQPMCSFLPRKHQDYFNVVHFKCEFELIYVGSDKKIEKNYKPCQRIGVLSNIDINIFTRSNLKLKNSYVLKHLYLGQCNDTQIANIDSCLRIGGPFGNDMIIRFQNPQTRNEWNKYINEQITAYQEGLKNITATITIFNDTNPQSSIPLVSKSISINGNTNGLALKKMAMGLFEIKDMDINDLSIIFSIKNKENVLHDDVSIMVLQDHVNNVQDYNCVKSCLDNLDKLTVIVKIIYYLRFTRIVAGDSFGKDGGKIIKKIITPKPKDEIKTKQSKYNISTRWIDNEIPNWLLSLLADLYNEGSTCEGIFRISGAVVQSDDYVAQICETDDIKIDASINTKASILKKFISIIDGSLLTSINKEQFMMLTNEINSVEEFLLHEEQQLQLLSYINKIPQSHLNLFQHILVVLNHIIQNSHINQMNLINLSTCFSQNLFKHLSDDAVKINRLFECILHLIDRIVDSSTFNSIAMFYESRNISIGLLESLKSENLSTLSVESNSPKTTSESAEDSKSFFSYNDKPLVPPRRRKGVNRNHRKNQQIIMQDSTIIPRRMTAIEVVQNRQSFCEECLGVTENVTILDNKNDFIDSQSTFSNSSTNLTEANPKTNFVPKDRKMYRSRNTFNTIQVVTSSDKQQQQPTNFFRQNQVSRKHQKNNSSLEKESNSNAQGLSQFSFKTNIPSTISKNVSKLTRSTDRVISKTRSRSQAKFSDQNVTEGAGSPSSKFPHRVNSDSSSLDSNNNSPNRDSKNRRRSSSACRVPQLRNQYESNILSTKPPPLPVKKNAAVSAESQNVSKLIREIEENKLFRAKETTIGGGIPCSPRTVKNNGPVRPPRYFISLSNTDQAHREIMKPQSPSYFSNMSPSLQDRLNDSNDDDVTYI